MYTYKILENKNLEGLEYLLGSRGTRDSEFQDFKNLEASEVLIFMKSNIFWNFQLKAISIKKFFLAKNFFLGSLYFWVSRFFRTVFEVQFPAKKLFLDFNTFQYSSFSKNFKNLKFSLPLPHIQLYILLRSAELLAQMFHAIRPLMSVNWAWIWTGRRHHNGICVVPKSKWPPYVSE